MRQCILAMVVVPLLVAGRPATAADLGGMSTPSEPLFSPNASSQDAWRGFYIGVNGGFGYGPDDVSNGTAFSNGFLGGALAGYNFRAGNFVFGLEGSLSTGALGPDVLPGFTGFSTNLDYQATLGLRAGVLLGPSLLLFGKIGGSYASMSITEAASAQAMSQGFYGYQVGLGAEWKLTNQLSMRLEYDYNSFDTQTVTFPDSTNAFAPAYNAVRLGLSYKF